MENNELYRYVVAVRAIMKEYGKMNDEDFIQHVVTCCKEAEELHTSLEEEITALQDLERDIKAERHEKLKERARIEYPFEEGERVLVKEYASRNKDWQEGIFSGTKIQWGDIVPIIFKVKKDGTASKFTFFESKGTEVRKK